MQQPAGGQPPHLAPVHLQQDLEGAARPAALLAEEYDFDFLAFWQPLLVLNEDSVTDEEQRFLWEMPGGLPDLFKLVYPKVQSAEHIHDLTHVLDAHEGSVWIDFNHLSPLGNEIVAEEMLKVMEPYLDQNL